MKHDETKLPKWVQAELKRLRDRVDFLERSLDAFPNKNARVTYTVKGITRGLPENCMVNFDLTGDMISITPSKEDLRLFTRHRRVEMIPQAAGAIIVRPEKF